MFSKTDTFLPFMLLSYVPIFLVLSCVIICKGEGNGKCFFDILF